mmetsp:Transcript_24681/g.58728  ORF Transcript_24681/g.58728 Transcript_24681/m.58728 type:complete len:536 (-) Transcript_24681:338-1945(-)
MMSARKGKERIPDLLEQLQGEYEALNQEHSVSKAQRDEYQRKLEEQLQDMGAMTQNLKELATQHQYMKKTYEEEIVRLRREIEAAGGTAPPSRSFAPPPETMSLPSFQSTPGSRPGQAGLEVNGGMVGGGAGSMLPLAGTPSRDAGGVVSAMSSAPAVDSEGRALDDWNVVHNPTCSSTKMNISLRHTLSHDSVVCCVRFSTDGRYMSTGCNKMAVLYDAETGNRICMFSSDGASVVENAEDLSTLSRPGGGCVDSYVRSVCFSPDSKYLVAGAEDKTIKVWDIAQRRLRHSLVGHTKDIYSVDYSSDGRFIISGSGDKRAKLWDVVSGECVRTFGDEEGPKDGVTSVAMSPDGRYVAAGSLDRVVRLWEASTGALLEKYDGHTDSVYSVSFSPDGKFLASGSLDKTLKLWDLTQVGKAAPGTLAGREAGRDKCRHTFQGHKDFVLSVVFAPQGTWLISGSKDRSVQFWDPRKVLAAGNTRAPNEAEHPSGDHGPVLILQGHQNSVISVAHSPAGMLFATGSGDKRSRIWQYSFA